MKDMVFYQAPGARTGDVIPKYIDGVYQLFYLKGWKDKNHPDYVPGWHRMESRDLVRMSGETPIHVLGGTGDLVFHEGQWHKAAKQFFDEQGLEKLPTVKSLQAEYAQLLSEKKAMYAEYQQAKNEMRSLQTAKANVERILGDDSLTTQRGSEKDGR